MEGECLDLEQWALGRPNPRLRTASELPCPLPSCKPRSSCPPRGMAVTPVIARVPTWHAAGLKLWCADYSRYRLSHSYHSPPRTCCEARESLRGLCMDIKCNVSQGGGELGGLSWWGGPR